MRWIVLATPMSGWLLAQAGGASSGDPVSIATLIAQVGISGVFIWREQQTRKDLIAEREANRDLAATAYPLLSSVAESLRNVNTTLANTAMRIQEAPQEAGHGLDLAMTAIAKELKALREDRGNG